MAIRDLIQEIVNKDYDELVGLGKAAFADNYVYLKDIVGEELVLAVVLGIVTSVAASDRYVSNAELNLINDITGLGLSAAGFRDLCEKANEPEFRNTLNKVIQAADDTHKNGILVLALVMASADETVTPDEMKRIAELLAE